MGWNGGECMTERVRLERTSGPQELVRLGGGIEAIWVRKRGFLLRRMGANLRARSGWKRRFVCRQNVGNWAGFAAWVGWIGLKSRRFWTRYSGFFFRAESVK